MDQLWMREGDGRMSSLLGRLVALSSGGDLRTAHRAQPALHRDTQNEHPRANPARGIASHPNVAPATPQWAEDTLKSARLGWRAVQWDVAPATFHWAGGILNLPPMDF